MARIMSFDNEKNSSCKTVKTVRKSSFKIRSIGGSSGSSSSSSSNRIYRATKLTVKGTMVNELASRFNAIVLQEEEDQEDNKDKNEKTFFTTTIQPSKKSSIYKNNNSVVKAAIKFFEKEQEEYFTNNNVKNKGTSGGATKIILLQKHHKSKINDTSGNTNTTKNNENKKSNKRAIKPKMVDKSDGKINCQENQKTTPVIDSKIIAGETKPNLDLNIKNKRLSIAKDFALESILNENKIADSENNGKIRNQSFLHGSMIQNPKENNVEHKNQIKDEEMVKDEKKDGKNSDRKNISTLHSGLWKLSKMNAETKDEESFKKSPVPEEDDERTYYEITQEEDEDDEEEHYTMIGDDYYELTDNIYDNLVSRFKNDDELRKSMEDSSDTSSCEQANSLYGQGHRPPSEISSEISSCISSSRGSKVDNSDDWIDIENSDDQQRQIILFTERPNNKNRFIHAIKGGWSRKVRRQKSKSRRRKCNEEISPPEKIEGKITVSDELCDDFDDSSSSESDNEYGSIPETDGDNYGDSQLPPPPQNIYGFVKKAGNSVKKRWSSLALVQIGKISSTKSHRSHANQLSKTTRSHSDSSFNAIRWSSFKSKFKSYTPVSSTSSTNSSKFYLDFDDEKKDQLNLPDKCKVNPVKRHSVINRPTCPPPPPPIGAKRNSIAVTGTSSVVTTDDSFISGCSSPGSNSNSSLSNDSNNVYSRFADEPLYQFYAASVTKPDGNSWLDEGSEFDGYEEISSTASRPSALELITPCPSGHGQYRSLWCEVPEVQNSGILDTLKTAEQKLQEAKFEIITSEASYFKSLTVLERHFAMNPSLRNILSKNHWKILFGNISAVRKCSEELLTALEGCWQDSILLNGICDILYYHATNTFNVYVKYCSNQIYIDRTFRQLREENERFSEIVNQLESDNICQSLSLHSFLMLPMQRITRLPLLMDAVLSRLSTESDEYNVCQFAFAAVNKVVQDCNEGARKLERYEEMLLLSRQLEFTKKDVKSLSVASSSRWLIRSGALTCVNVPDAKLTITRKLTNKLFPKLHFFLFNDMLFIAKKKGEENYVVVDYCARNLVQITELDDAGLSPSLAHKYLVTITLLENHEKKTVEMVMSCESMTCRQRWIEALSKPVSENPEEVLYEEWDCPQVSATHNYTAVQPDELSLQQGDTVKVLRKMADGWYHGERIRDGMKGWFPGNYVVEIASQHARAKNLKMRYRLLSLSASYLQHQNNE